MPPLRSERASKACDTCRKQKTRCYASANRRGMCLRCETLKQRCSLGPTNSDAGEFGGNFTSPPSTTPSPAQSTSMNERLERLEEVTSSLSRRLDSLTGHILPDAPATSTAANKSSLESEPAPVFLIRDVANEMGVHSPTEVSVQTTKQLDIISKGLLTATEAHMLLSIFNEHYARWIALDDSPATQKLSLQSIQSPLLFCSICLIAVRHTTEELAMVVAPRLLEEAQTLLSKSLLTVAHSVQFFQSALILSLWSTTIGQVPLSMDGWLLTSYAIQQAQASPVFAEAIRATATPLPRDVVNVWCIWNHLCLAHLQYCVGTRRKAAIGESDIDMCQRLPERVNLSQATNFEVRMVAEINLYWIIYKQCCSTQIDRATTETALSAWKQASIALFDEPRSQFLQMGYHFAQLLSFSQFIRSVDQPMRESSLTELVRLATEIINLAMNTTDDRTRHLTDHIYHIITFSAITLCRLLGTHEQEMRMTHNTESLDLLVTRLVVWLKSIGLRCHVAHMLGDVIAAQQKKLRPAAQSSLPESANSDNTLLWGDDWYPDFIRADMFDFDIEDQWPPWDR